MKAVLATSLFFWACLCSPAQTNHEITVVGDWSAPSQSVRGRLIVSAPRSVHNAEEEAKAKIYVELENVQTNYTWSTTQIPVNEASDLFFDLRNGDGDDDLTYQVGGWSWNGVFPPPYTISLPKDSTIKVRVDTGMGSGRPGLSFWALGIKCGGPRTIPFWSTNDYYLSATFEPPPQTNSPGSVFIWHGKLELPKVKMPKVKTENP